MLQKVNEIISPSFPVIRVFKRRLTNIEDGFILQPFLELKLELKGFKSAWKWFWIVYYDRAAAGWCHCDCTVQWPWLNFYNWGWALVVQQAAHYDIVSQLPLEPSSPCTFKPQCWQEESQAWWDLWWSTDILMKCSADACLSCDLSHKHTIQASISRCKAAVLLVCGHTEKWLAGIGRRVMSVDLPARVLELWR